MIKGCGVPEQYANVPGFPMVKSTTAGVALMYVTAFTGVLFPAEKRFEDNADERLDKKQLAEISKRQIIAHQL